MTISLPFRKSLPALLLLLLPATNSFGGIYPEHRDIMLSAIRKLSPERRAVLEKLWTEARLGHESRLSLLPADTAQGEKPAFIDYGAWPAIAGDHSVSGADLLHNVLETEWILGVADVTAALKNNLANAKDRSDVINSLRDSDIKLQRVDPAYATRAGANNVHFLLARDGPDADMRAYLRHSVQAGTPLNAIGTYAWYHLSALLQAGRLSREQLSPEDRAALARAALADEAFSLHFMEDAFAAGHVTGTWGDASLRKGTHDYYNESGFETRSWLGKPMILMGDAWMGPEDIDRAANIVTISLAQFVDAVAGTGAGAMLATTEAPTLQADTFNVAQNTVHLPRQIDTVAVNLLAETLLETPIPALGAGRGELPRFRAELGPFIGFSPSAFTGTLGGGFGAEQTDIGAIGGLAIALRLGLGIEGVINEAGDGLVFLDLGFKLDAASSQNFAGSDALEQYGSITAQIPARSAITTRLRMPFYLLPFDLLLTAPFLLPFAPATFVQMAVAAGSGGLIPWQAGIATSFGRFQFMLGREIGVAFYGYGKEEDRMFIPYATETSPQVPVVALRSVQLEIPVIEYRPFRSFSMDQSSSMLIQLYGGVDIPTKVTVISPPGDPKPEIRSTWTTGIRFVFDWRSYLGTGTGAHR